MRKTVLAAAVVLMAAAPSFAAVKHQAAPSKPSYNACEALAVARSVPPGRGAGANAEAHFNTFVRDCLAGKIPFAA